MKIDRTKLSGEVKNKYSFENETFKFKPKDDLKDRIEIEIGDDSNSEFIPCLKIKRWDDEVNCEIKLKDSETGNKKVETDKDKIKWSKGNITAHFYDLTEGEGGYEFEVILKEKPATNKIEFTLQTKGLDFFYQPELTQQEKDEGAFRPENVIGSYAVYTSEQKTNWTGGKLYKAGKFGHIYRPKIIDSAGKETWGILNIDKGILSVEIPQKFLDEAVYPVRHAAGLTFGYTTEGTAGASSATGWVNFIKGTPSGGDGTVDSISLSCREQVLGGSTNTKGIIYLVSTLAIITNGITPATLITPGATKNWQIINYSTKPSVVNNTNYYIGIIWETSSQVNVYFDNGAAGDGGCDASTYADPVLTAPLSDNTRKYSIYATYTAAGAAATGAAFLFNII